MEHTSPEDLRRLDAPRFAAYATLLRGIEYERGYVAWCEWMLGVIEAQGPE